MVEQPVSDHAALAGARGGHDEHLVLKAGVAAAEPRAAAQPDREVGGAGPQPPVQRQRRAGAAAVVQRRSAAPADHQLGRRGEPGTGLQAEPDAPPGAADAVMREHREAHGHDEDRRPLPPGSGQGDPGKVMSARRAQ